jgi:hypothetical protein
MSAALPDPFRPQVRKRPPSAADAAQFLLDALRWSKPVRQDGFTLEPLKR